MVGDIAGSVVGVADLAGAMVDSAVATVDSAADTRSRRLSADSRAEARFVAGEDTMAAVDTIAAIIVAADIMARVLDSASACMRLTITAMLLRPATRPDFMMPTASGNIIRVALCRTGTKLARMGRTHWNAALAALNN
jgi:hypothetical protein